MAKAITSSVTSTAKNPLVATMKKYRLSTRAAIVDACSGNKGMEGSMCSRKVRSIQSRALQACALRGRGPLRSRRRIRTMAPAINPTVASPAARTAVITAML